MIIRACVCPRCGHTQAVTPGPVWCGGCWVKLYEVEPFDGTWPIDGERVADNTDRNAVAREKRAQE